MHICFPRKQAETQSTLSSCCFFLKRKKAHHATWVMGLAWFLFLVFLSGWGYAYKDNNAIYMRGLS